MLARAVFAGRHQKPCPFEGPQNATGEHGHVAPAGRVPILRLAVEGFEQSGLGRAVVGLDIDDVHPDIPLAKGAIIEPRVRGVIDTQNEIGDQFGEQPARGPRQLGAPLGQTELALEVPPQAERDQQVVQHFERRELVFVDHLVVAEHFFGAFSRPAEVLDGPMDEDPLERLGLGEANRSVLLRVLQRQECCAQHGRMREIGMVIRELAEFDHVPFMAQAVRQCQPGREGCSGGLRT
jgi:hypothetical protein